MPSASCVSASAQAKAMSGTASASARSTRPMARNGVKPLRPGRCNSCTYPSSSTRNAATASLAPCQSCGSNAACACWARLSCSSTAALLVLAENRSRQKSPSPTCCSRRCTTSSAGRFSATNSTLRPCASVLTMMLAMVWLLPAPGGPISTKLCPDATAATARSCELSASSGQSRSSVAAPASGGSGGPAPAGPSISRRATALRRSASACAPKSFHIRNVVNDRLVRATSSVTSQPGRSRSRARNPSSTLCTSRPDSSSGGRSASSAGKRRAKSWRSISSRVVLMRVSSSCARSENPERKLGRSSTTGTRMTGSAVRDVLAFLAPEQRADGQEQRVGPAFLPGGTGGAENLGQRRRQRRVVASGQQFAPCQRLARESAVRRLVQPGEMHPGAARVGAGHQRRPGTEAQRRRAGLAAHLRQHVFQLRRFGAIDGERLFTACAQVQQPFASGNVEQPLAPPGQAVGRRDRRRLRFGREKILAQWRRRFRRWCACFRARWGHCDRFRQCQRADAPLAGAADVDQRFATAVFLRGDIVASGLAGGGEPGAAAAADQRGLEQQQIMQCQPGAQTGGVLGHRSAEIMPRQP